MRILGRCRRILSFAGLINEKSVQIAGKRYPIVVFRATVILTQLWIFSIQIVKAVKYHAISTQGTLFALYTCLTIFIKLATYVVMLAKVDQIADIFDYLQAVVRRRMFAPIFRTLPLRASDFILEFFSLHTKTRNYTVYHVLHHLCEA